MKRTVLAMISLISVAAFAQAQSAPVASPNRISGGQAAAASMKGGDPKISSGLTSAPLLLVDSAGRVVGRPVDVGASSVILRMNGKTTAVSGLLAPNSLLYASSDCAGTTYVPFGFPGVEQKADIVLEDSGVFNAYVADASQPPVLVTIRSRFLNGVCQALGPHVSAVFTVTTVVPASSFGTPPFHLE